MPNYIAIFGAKKPFTPSAYPALFKHLTSLTHGARFTDTVIGFHSEEERRDVIDVLKSHIDPTDEVLVFEIRAAVWQLKPERKKSLETFLGSIDQ